MTLDVDIREPLETFTLKVKFSASAGLIALFGPSGSGKTTTLNVLAGIRRPEYARVLFDNDVIVDTERGIWKAAHTRRVGYVFQDSRLFPHLTVRHNLRFGRWFNRKHKSDAISEAHLVELLGLGPERVCPGRRRRTLRTSGADLVDQRSISGFNVITRAARPCTSPTSCVT